MVQAQAVIRRYLRDNLSPHRYKHCLGVETMAISLAEKFGFSSLKCGIAGLSHDICREMSGEDLILYTGLYHKNPVLLHGIAGVKMLRSDFLIDDTSILDAVRFHISGAAGLDEIGKIVFVSDYIEMGRTHIDNDERERLFLLDLDDMVLDIALKTKGFLKSKDCPIESDLNELIDELQKEK